MNDITKLTTCTTDTSAPYTFTTYSAFKLPTYLHFKGLQVDKSTHFQGQVMDEGVGNIHINHVRQISYFRRDYLDFSSVNLQSLQRQAVE